MAGCRVINMQEKEYHEELKLRGAPTVAGSVRDSFEKKVISVKLIDRVHESW